MKTMGKYCKAYPVARLRQFSGWQENLLNLRKEKKEVEGKQVEMSRELTDDDHLYLQENLVVTDGIFLDENIIFDKVSEEWEQYCREVLKFEVPVYEPLVAQSGQP